MMMNLGLTDDARAPEIGSPDPHVPDLQLPFRRTGPAPEELEALRGRPAAQHEQRREFTN